MVGAAILALFAIFGSVWAYQMAREPKRWRLWWLTALRIIEIDTPRERRRSQETKLAVVSSILCLACVVTAVVCVYEVTVDFQDRHRTKTPFEMDRDQTRKQIQEMQSKQNFKKLS